METIFSKIIRGEIPCDKVYEDDKTLAFMDIDPIQAGMVLVVSKQSVDHIWDLEKEDYQALMETVRKVGRRMREVFPNKKRVGVIVEGFEVAHVHVKVFPIDSGEELRALPYGNKADPAVLSALGERLRITD